MFAHDDDAHDEQVMVAKAFGAVDPSAGQDYAFDGSKIFRNSPAARA